MSDKGEIALRQGKPSSGLSLALSTPGGRVLVLNSYNSFELFWFYYV
jgi:hypothetical protein